MALPGISKNGPKPKPPKRPAQTSSQDAGMHPPKKQRIDEGAEKGKGTVKVASAGAGARAGGKGAVKVKVDGNEKVDEKQRSAKGGEEKGEKGREGLIAAAPAVMEKPADVKTTSTKETAEIGPKAAGTASKVNGAASTASVSATINPVAEQKTIKPVSLGDDNDSGPSKRDRPSLKPKQSKPSNRDSTNTDGKQLKIARRMPPVKPITADAQNALGRPKNASGSNATRGIEGRDVVFVTRKTSLGSYMRRCKTLLVEDGLNQITLHALCVAIPHAVMLLYALTDILPFPRQFIHHEIQTSSVECHDEMSLVAAELVKGGPVGTDKSKGKGKALAIFEEEEAGIRSRTKSGIRITIRIGKGARVSAAEHENPLAQKTGGKKARPNKVQRVAKRVQEDVDGDADMGEPVGTMEEEERMNEEAVEGMKVDASKQQTETPATKGNRKGGEKTEGPPGGARKQKKGGAKQKPQTSAVAMEVD